MVPRSDTAITEMALPLPEAVSDVPSIGSTATSVSGFEPSPTSSPLNNMGASSFSPSPMTTMPLIGTVPSTIRMASTAAPSAPILSPRPTQRLAAMAADSVVRTSSRARLRSGRSEVITYKPSALTNLRSCPFCPSSYASLVSRSLTCWCALGVIGSQELSQTAPLLFCGCGQSMAVL